MTTKKATAKKPAAKKAAVKKPETKDDIQGVCITEFVETYIRGVERTFRYCIDNNTDTVYWIWPDIAKLIYTAGTPKKLRDKNSGLFCHIRINIGRVNAVTLPAARTILGSCLKKELACEILTALEEAENAMSCAALAAKNAAEVAQTAAETAQNAAEEAGSAAVAAASSAAVLTADPEAEKRAAEYAAKLDEFMAANDKLRAEIAEMKIEAKKADDMIRHLNAAMKQAAEESIKDKALIGAMSADLGKISCILKKYPDGIALLADEKK